MKALRPTIILAVLLLVLVYSGYFLYPMWEMVKESLTWEGAFSLSHYGSLLDPANASTFEAITNSVVVSLLSVLSSGVLGVFLAFVFTQCDVPLRKMLAGIAVLPIALPPLVGVIAFLFVFGESGILPRLVHEATGVSAGMFALDGVSAIVAVHAYSFYVYFYLFVGTALRSLDASQLEAARMLGSSNMRTLRTVVLPEVKPALLGASLLTFMASMASFSAPLLFGGDKRFMTLQIYNAKLNGEVEIASAMSVGLAVIAIAFYGLLHAVRGIRRNARRSKGAGREGRIVLGRGVQWILVAVSILFLMIEILPILTIFLISFAREGSWTWQLLPDAYTWENYTKLVREPQVFDPILNSVAMTGVTLLLCVLVGVSAAFFISRSRENVRGVLDLVVTLPFAIPGTVVAIGMILAFNRPTFFSGYSVLVGTFWILPIAYFTRMFPMVSRATASALETLDESQVEAGKTFGAGGIRRFRKIVLPAILPGVVSGGLLVAITALGEFVSSILLYSYSNRPVAVEILAQMRNYNFGAAAAYSVFLLVIILGLTALSSRFSRSAEGRSGFNI